MRFTVVVITRDRRQSLLAVLAQVRKLTEDAPVIVVDNASRDGTADAVAAGFPTSR